MDTRVYIWFFILCCPCEGKQQDNDVELISESFNIPTEFKGYHPFMTLSNPSNCSYSNIGKLIDDKQPSYNRFVIPKLTMLNPLTIQVGFNLIAFRDFDEVDEKFSVVGSLDILWKDEHMTWNASEYGGLQTFMIAKEMFWTPILVLVNAYETYKMVGEESYWPIRYSYTGMAFYFPGSVFTSTCSADVSNYPWDYHVCTLTFSAYGYSSTEIQLEPLHKKALLKYFPGHGEWQIVDSKVETIYNDLVIMFRFEFKRKPLFVLVNIIIPIIFMSLLNSLVFLIPVEAGERVSYSITVLLAIAVFLTLVSENMPKSGKTIAVLSYYLLSLLSLSMLIMTGTVISMRIHKRSPRVNISRGWKLFRRCMCQHGDTRRELRRSSSKISRSDVNYSVTQSDDDDPTCGNDKWTGECKTTPSRVRKVSKLCGKRSVFKHIRDCTGIEHSNASKLGYLVNDEGDHVTWKGLGCALDMFFFIVTFILLALFTVMYFVYIITHSQ